MPDFLLLSKKQYGGFIELPTSHKPKTIQDATKYAELLSQKRKEKIYIGEIKKIVWAKEIE